MKLIMAELTPEYSIPLKVVSVRLNHLKSNLDISKKIEERAIRNYEYNKKFNLRTPWLLTWDDWIDLAFQAEYERRTHTEAHRAILPTQAISSTTNTKTIKQGPLNAFLNMPPGRDVPDVYEMALQQLLKSKGLAAKKPDWAKDLKHGEVIPQEYYDRLPVTAGELVTLGNWMLTKNIYRFEDVVIREILKSEFTGVIPNHIINLPDLCIYVQTDNANLKFENTQVVGVLFTVTSVQEQKVLVSTMYLDTGLPRTIAILIEEDKDVESSLTEFFDEFQPDDKPISDKALNDRIKIQKKLINLVLWFSLDEPETLPIHEHKIEKYSYRNFEKNKKLFEATKYKAFSVGSKTANLFQKVYKELETAKADFQARGGKIAPHLRRPHWQVYWHGKRRLNEAGKWVGEREELVFHPINMIGGTPKK